MLTVDARPRSPVRRCHPPSSPSSFPRGVEPAAMMAAPVSTVVIVPAMMSPPPLAVVFLPPPHPPAPPPPPKYRRSNSPGWSGSRRSTRPFSPNRHRFSSGWDGITLDGMRYFVASILFMPPDDFIAYDIAFIACDACDACDIAFVACVAYDKYDIAFVARMHACDGNLKKIRLSDCLKTVWEFFWRDRKFGRRVSSRHLRTDFFSSLFFPFRFLHKKEVRSGTHLRQRDVFLPDTMFQQYSRPVYNYVSGFPKDLEPKESDGLALAYSGSRW